MRNRRSSWTGSAALRTRTRKDGPLEEQAVDEETPSGRSEREETQPAAPGDLLRLQEDIQVKMQRTDLGSLVFANHCCVTKTA